MYITPAEMAASQAANQYTSQPAPQAASGLPTATNTQAGTQAISDYVSQVMAMGGISDEQKSQMIRSQAYATGTTPEQIAAATGYGQDKVNAYLGLSQAPAAPTQQQITAAEQQARQARMDMGMEGRKQGVDPSVYQTLYSTNAQGQTVRNSDGYAAPFSLNQISNPNAREYYAQNPQELFALGALGGGGGQGYFKEAGVRGTTKKLGQLTPDQYYQGYTSNFQDKWMDNIDPNYRYAGQQSAQAPGGSGGGSGGSTGGSGGGSSGGSTGGSGGGSGGSGGIVGGMFTDYVKRPANAGIPSDYNPNQAGAGGTSSNYNDQLNSYYKAYFGDAGGPNNTMLDSWYGGSYSPAPTGFSSTNKGASSAKGIVQSLKWDPANYNASIDKLNEYRQTYGLSAKDIADAIGTDEATVIAEFAKRGINVPVTQASAAPPTNADDQNQRG